MPGCRWTRPLAQPHSGPHVTTFHGRHARETRDEQCCGHNVSIASICAYTVRCAMPLRQTLFNGRGRWDRPCSHAVAASRACLETPSRKFTSPEPRATAFATACARKRDYAHACASRTDIGPPSFVLRCHHRPDTRTAATCEPSCSRSSSRERQREGRDAHTQRRELRELPPRSAYQAPVPPNKQPSTTASESLLSGGESHQSSKRSSAVPT